MLDNFLLTYLFIYVLSKFYLITISCIFISLISLLCLLQIQSKCNHIIKQSCCNCPSQNLFPVYKEFVIFCDYISFSGFVVLALIQKCPTFAIQAWAMNGLMGTTLRSKGSWVSVDFKKGNFLKIILIFLNVLLNHANSYKILIIHQ